MILLKVATALFALSLSLNAVQGQTTNSTYQPGPAICKPGGKGLFLPLDYEQDWPMAGRTVLYAIVLAYFFAGVAVTADAFMEAIEQITSTTSTKYNKAGEQYDISTWNPTVANLTLMALGSSAPEIILAVIEIFSNDFYAGDLGPGTIVGSAAFNLLVIIAFCMWTIGPNDTRRIAMPGVFAVTAFFSIFAYIWLIFVLEVTSPNVIEIWEAVVTLLFFPLLVAVAWIIDRQNVMTGASKILPKDAEAAITPEKSSSLYPNNLTSASTSREVASPTSRAKLLSVKRGDNMVADKDDIEDMLEEIQRNTESFDTAEPADETIIDPNCNRISTISEESTELMNSKSQSLNQSLNASLSSEPPKSPRASIGSISSIWKRPHRKRKTHASFVGSQKIKHLSKKEFVGKGIAAFKNVKLGFDGNSDVGFAHNGASVLSTVDNATLQVLRGGDLSKSLLVDFKTEDCTVHVMPHEHYVPTSGTLLFGPNEDTKEIVIKIVGGQNTDAKLHGAHVDDAFLVVLENARFEADVDDSKTNPLIRNNTSYVSIVFSDGPGVLNLVSPKYRVLENQGPVEFKIVRTGGAGGAVTCQYGTEDGSALQSSDYIKVSGTLEFDAGETEKCVSVEIIDDDTFEHDERFYFSIWEGTDGVRIGATYKATIVIVNDDEIQSVPEKINAILTFNKDKFKLVTTQWTDNIYESITFSDKGFVNRILWLVMIPWNLIAGIFIPPVSWLGAWPAFFISLTLTGIITAVIGDLAALFGCCIGLSDYVTAITIVALGTSLPDTFASAYAAKNDPTADGAIGNVTGSNSVNVFCGLGIAWTIGAVYWEGFNNGDEDWRDRIGFFAGGDKVVGDFPDGVFFVSKGIVSFSVGIYCGCAVLAIVLLVLRRSFVGAELGGKGTKLSALISVFLWLVFIVLSSLKSEGNI